VQYNFFFFLFFSFLLLFLLLRVMQERVGLVSAWAAHPSRGACSLALSHWIGIGCNLLTEFQFQYTLVANKRGLNLGSPRVEPTYFGSGSH
jgi:hypothetical protein